MNIVGKFLAIADFQAYVNGVTFTGWKPSFVVVHNTSSPDLALYAEWLAHPQKHGSWTHEQWLRNLAGYYSGMGWQAGPHCFVCPDGVGLFTPLTQHGTHSPSWNSKTWGIETVGEFESEPFASPIADNLIKVLAVLSGKAGLDPAAYQFGRSGLHLHKEDPLTSHKSCPGRKVVKPTLVASVKAAAPLLPTTAPLKASDVDDRLDAIARSMAPGDKLSVPLHVQEAATGGMNDDELKAHMRLEVRKTLRQPPQGDM